MHWSLRTRFMFVFISLAVVPLLVVGGGLYISNSDIQRDYALDLQSELAKRVAVQLVDFVRSRENELRLLSEVRGLNRLDLDQQEAILTVLRSYQSVRGELEGSYDELALLDSSGQEVVRVSRRAVISADDLRDRSDDPAYSVPAATGETYYSPVIFPEDMNEPVMTVSIPLFDLRAGGLTHVLVADFRFKAFWDLISSRTDAGRSVYVVDEDGRVVAHNNRSKVGEYYDVPESEGVYTSLDGDFEALIKVAPVQFGVGDAAQRFYVVAEQSTTRAFEPVVRTLVFSGVAILIAFVISGGLALIAINQIVRPIEYLAQVADSISQGDLSQRARVVGGDEIASLARAFNSMTDQLRGLIGQLEQRVAERTRELTAIAEVGRTATQIHDEQELLDHVVNLLQMRFGFSQVYVFLVDSTRREAVLSATTGSMGAQLAAQGYALPVSGRSVVAQVISSSELVVIPDIEREDAAYRANPLLLDARAEMGLPLRVAGQVIGVLVAQSVEPNAFQRQDFEVFQGMADQIAIALNNSRLLRESEERLNQIEKLNLELTGESWRRYLRNYPDQVLGFKADARGLHPVSALSSEEANTLRSSKPIVYSHEDTVSVALPIRFRGLSIGRLEFEIDESEFTEEVLVLAQMLATRLGDSADSARLFETARDQTRREQTLSLISGTLQEQSTIESVLSTAVEEIGRALGARRSAVRLGSQFQDLSTVLDDGTEDGGDSDLAERE